MKIGAWIHDYSGQNLEEQVRHAATAGIRSVRSYHFDYSRKIAPLAKEQGMTLLAGIPVDSEGLVKEWSSQVRLDDLDSTIALECPLEAICVGNELREGGDDPATKRFTARLSYGLARLIETYRNHLERSGASTRFTYAMEVLVFDDSLQFKDSVLPLIDACDVVSLNSYPITDEQWFGYSAFEANAEFLRNDRVWRRKLSIYEARLRNALELLMMLDKPLILSEMGFPSGVGYRIDGTIKGNDHIWPVHDLDAFGNRMREYVELLSQISRDYGGLLETVHFYEWWDNHYHSKIWNVEQSPMHTCFGLCDEAGNEKLDISALCALAAPTREAR